MKTKKLLSLLLSLALVVGMIPAFGVTAYANYGGYHASLSEIDFGMAKPGYSKLVHSPEILNDGSEELKSSNAKIVFEGGNSDVFEVYSYSGNSIPNTTSSLGFSVGLADDLPEGEYWSQAILLYDRDGESSFAYDYQELDRAPVRVIITKDAPTFTYSVINGTIDGKSSVKASQGQRFWLKANDPPSGKEFYQWMIVENSSTGDLGPYKSFFTKGQASQYIITNSFKSVAYTLTFEAKYKTANTWLVKFDANGGSGTQKDIEVPKGSRLTLPECTFTPPEGMVFDKWDVGSPGQSGSINSDTTVKAIWKAKPVTIYTITVDDGTADKSTAKAGETVTISAEPAKENFSFTGWTAVTEDARPVTFADRFSLNTTFVMPDCDVRMIPNYKYSGSVLTDFYVFITPPVAGQHPQAPTVNVDNYVIDSYRWGKITNSGSSTMTSSDVFEAGTGILYQCRVDLKAKGAIVGDADQLVGYVNGSTKTDGIDVMTFRLGLDKARVVGSFNCSSARTNPFVDVSESDYFYEPVLWAVDKGITNGTDATHFSPTATCTRGQVVTFLWRAAGSPTPTSTTNPFTDVTPSDYYYNAVLWAVGKNITNGTSATTFGPNAGCTRGQVVTFLHRFENSPKPSSTTNPFVDVSSSEYYYTPVLWAVGKGITNGTDATHFSPNATCTRGQIVTFLYRDMK